MPYRYICLIILETIRVSRRPEITVTLGDRSTSTNKGNDRGMTHNHRSSYIVTDLCEDNRFERITPKNKPGQLCKSDNHSYININHFTAYFQVIDYVFRTLHLGFTVMSCLSVQILVLLDEGANPRAALCGAVGHCDYSDMSSNKDKRPVTVMTNLPGAARRVDVLELAALSTAFSTLRVQPAFVPTGVLNMTVLILHRRYKRA